MGDEKLKAKLYFENREFKQIATAGAGEYVSVVCPILAKRNTKKSET